MATCSTITRANNDIYASNNGSGSGYLSAPEENGTAQETNGVRANVCQVVIRGEGAGVRSVTGNLTYRQAAPENDVAFRAARTPVLMNCDA